MFSIPNITLYKFIFNLEALEDMNLPPYKGSMFRGAFGATFRKVVCVTHKPNCDNCILQLQCSYFRIFETEITDNNIWFLKGVKKLPHPFIIDPPLEEKRGYAKGDSLEVGLTIFGEYINFLPFFVYTFQQMGGKGISYKRSKFQLDSVYNISLEKEILIFSSKDNMLKTGLLDGISIDTLDFNYPGKEITLDFISPFRVQKTGKVFTNPQLITPEILLQTLERRIFAIASLFCNSGNNWQPIKIENDLRIAENNLYFYDWERYSSRQKTKILLGGFRGRLKLEGDIKRYYPLFKCGEHLNIGKNTVFGLGKYSIIPY